MHPATVRHHFAGRYAEARQKFLGAAQARMALLQAIHGLQRLGTAA